MNAREAAAKWPELNLPNFDPKVRSTTGKVEIFDAVRRKYVILTPEEWVRQHFIHFLSHNLGYPISRMWLERNLKYGAVNKRPDICVINSEKQAEIIVECKAPSVSIDQSTFDQIAVYSKVLGAKYLAVTNGMQHFYCHFVPEAENFVFIKELPKFNLN